MKHGWKTRIDERRYFEEKKTAALKNIHERMVADMKLQIMNDRLRHLGSIQQINPYGSANSMRGFSHE